MDISHLFRALVPWIVFTLIVQSAGPGSAGIASATAVLLAAARLLLSRRGAPRLVEITGITTFGVMMTLAFLGSSQARSLVAEFGRGGSALVLALVMLLSAATVPFTEPYARTTVPEALWSTPGFRNVNRAISATWSVVIALVGTSHLFYGYLAATSPDGTVARPGNLVLNWIVPVGLIYLGAGLTQRISDPTGLTPSSAGAAETTSAPPASANV